MKDDSFGSPPTVTVKSYHFLRIWKLNLSVLLKLNRLFNWEISDMDTPPNKVRNALLKPAFKAALAMTSTWFWSFTLTPSAFLFTPWRFDHRAKKSTSVSCWLEVARWISIQPKFSFKVKEQLVFFLAIYFVQYDIIIFSKLPIIRKLSYENSPVEVAGKPV